MTVWPQPHTQHPATALINALINALSRNLTPLFGLGVLFVLAFVVGRPPDAPRAAAFRLRLGYFANVTHAPAVVGVGRGTFANALGKDTTLDPKVFNAGPEAMEALLAGEIDICYVGPAPAANTFLKSGGKALKIVAGACSGGAALIARDGVNVTTVRDLEGKRVAIPQKGGTQDISLRHFLASQNLRGTENGGTVQILAVKNADMLTLFKSKELDAAWVPEPWAARLIHDANARLVLDERDLWPGHKVTTTVVVVRRAYLEQHRGEVERVLSAHLQTLAWMQTHPDDAQHVVNAELKRITGKSLSDVVLREAWSRCDFTADPNAASIAAFMQAQREAGYLPQTIDVAQLLDTRPLQQAAPTEYAKR